MEIDIIGLATTVVASGAGWYAGHYFERKKALKFFENVKQSYIRSSAESTTRFAAAAVALLHKYKPGINSDDDLTDELLASCQAQGMDVRRMTAAKAKEFGVDNNA
jgi:hypothetical protein